MFDIIDKTSGEIVRRIRQPHERLRILTEFSGESLTKQAFKDLTDVNNIVNRYDRTGLLEGTKKFPPQYADVTSLQVDLTESINSSRQIIADAAENDSKLAKQRERKEKDRIAAEQKELAELRAFKENNSQQPEM